MSVDFAKIPHILVVHGVQSGDSASVDCEKSIRKLIDRSLSASHLEKDFEVKGFIYEDMNDKAQKLYKGIAKALTLGKPLAGKALEVAIDVVGDVVTARLNTGTAQEIRKALRKKILESYASGHKLIVIAHSLGTIYALDVINDLIESSSHFIGDDRGTWPVQGFVTLGSPLGIDKVKGVELFSRREINSLKGALHASFSWHNYFNRLDPIVSGDIFGAPAPISGATGPVEALYGPTVRSSNWLLKGHVTTAGKQWLPAHVAYWKDRSLGDQLVNTLWG